MKTKDYKISFEMESEVKSAQILKELLEKVFPDWHEIKVEELR